MREFRWKDLLILGALMFAFLGMRWAFLEDLDALTYDFLLRVRGTESPDPRVVIVAIDDISLQRLGSWPWPSEVLKQLFQAIDESEPRATGIDLLLSQPIGEYLEASALPRTVLATSLGLDRNGRFFWQPAQAGLEREPAGWGHIHAGKDADGVCRSLPLSVSHDGRVRLAFSIELARVFHQIPSESVQWRLDGLEIGDKSRIPRLGAAIDPGLDASGVLPSLPGDHLLINFRGDSGTFPQLSAADLLENGSDSRLREKIVLVGATSYSLGDHLSTAFSGTGEMAGIEIHANALDTILNERYIRSLQEPAATLLILGLIFTFGALFRWWSPFRKPLTLLCCGLLLLLAGIGLFLAAAFWIPLFSLTTALVLTASTSQFMHHAALNRHLNRKFRELSRELSEGQVKNLLDESGSRHSVEWKIDVLGQATETALQLTRERSELISFMSHELKTPMTSIQGFAELLSRGQDLSREDRREALDLIYDESRRLSSLLNDYLQLSRLQLAPEATELTLCDVRELLLKSQAIVRREAAKRNIEIQLHEPGRTPLILGAPPLLTQLFLNLISNAIKFSSDRGRVDIMLESDSDRISITVRDQGIGIPASELERIFDKFYRVRTDSTHGIPGSGLGLALAREVVHRLGGEMEVWSRPGEGSAFTVHLPIPKRETET